MAEWHQLRNETDLDVLIGLTPFATEEVTATGSAQRLDITLFAPAGQRPAKYAYITVEDEAIRYRVARADPTGSEGHLWDPTDNYATHRPYILLRSIVEITTFRFIRDAVALTPDLKVTYYR